MKWINLKNNKCPNCGKDFIRGLSISKSTGAMHHPCGFMISEQRYKEIISSQVAETLTQESLNRSINQLKGDQWND